MCRLLKIRPYDRVGRVVHGAAEVELDAALGEVIDNVPGVRQRSSEPVELRDNERVACAAGGERLAQARAVAVSAGQAVVDVHALRRYAERLQALALGGEVLRVGGDACVADLQLGHVEEYAV